MNRTTAARLVGASLALSLLALLYVLQPEPNEPKETLSSPIGDEWRAASESRNVLKRSSKSPAGAIDSSTGTAEKATIEIVDSCNGRPIAGAAIFIGNGRLRILRPAHDGTARLKDSDAEGKCSFAYSEIGRDQSEGLVITVVRSGFSCAAARAPAEGERLRVALEPERTQEFRFVDDDGNPVPGVRTVVSAAAIPDDVFGELASPSVSPTTPGPSARRIHVAVSGLDGRCRIDGLQDADYVARFDHPEKLPIGARQSIRFRPADPIAVGLTDVIAIAFEVVGDDVIQISRKILRSADPEYGLASGVDSDRINDGLKRRWPKCHVETHLAREVVDREVCFSILCRRCGVVTRNVELKLLSRLEPVVIDLTNERPSENQRPQMIDVRIVDANGRDCPISGSMLISAAKDNPFHGALPLHEKNGRLETLAAPGEYRLSLPFGLQEYCEKDLAISVGSRPISIELKPRCALKLLKAVVDDDVLHSRSILVLNDETRSKIYRIPIESSSTDLWVSEGNTVRIHAMAAGLTTDDIVIGYGAFGDSTQCLTFEKK